VASIIERINFDCPINLMLAIISLTAPLAPHFIREITAEQTPAFTAHQTQPYWNKPCGRQI